jgi:hypothetical protein
VVYWILLIGGAISLLALLCGLWFSSLYTFLCLFLGDPDRHLSNKDFFQKNLLTPCAISGLGCCGMLGTAVLLFLALLFHW